MLLGCTGPSSEAASGSGAAPAKTVEAEPAKAPEPDPTDAVEPTDAVDPTPPDDDATAAVPPPVVEAQEPTEARRIEAYTANCGHEFLQPFGWEPDEEGYVDPPVNECDVFEWDQNCAPDPSGCWDDGQECIRGCIAPCNDCQTACTGGCDQCKAACPEGASDCVRACAQERLVCHQGCIAARSKCMSDDCPKTEAKCNAAFDRERKRECPECAAISECLDRNLGAVEDYEKACMREFPTASVRCFEWCMDYYEVEAEPPR